jgi:hypothetical protein
MQVLKEQETIFVSGGDRWCDTPEGRATLSGGAASQHGPHEVCRMLDYNYNGAQIEVCLISRTTG